MKRIDVVKNTNGWVAETGGDTVVTLVSNGRRIPLVAVHVAPRANPPGDAILFYGDMYLDADWKQIVRMRGRLVEVRDGKVTISAGSRIPGVSGASVNLATEQAQVACDPDVASVEQLQAAIETALDAGCFERRP